MNIVKLTLMRAGGAVAAFVIAASLGAGAAPALGDAFGELGKVGSFGSGAGQFTYPSDLAVDTEDNDAFVLDAPNAERRGAGPTSFRVQVFAPPVTATSRPVADVEIPTPVGAEGHKTYVSEIAVDAALHRLYVLKTTQTPHSSLAEWAGLEIDAYSTEPQGGALVPANVETNGKKGVFYQFPAVSSGALPAGALLRPSAMSVNTKTHALVVAGEDETGRDVLESLNSSSPAYTTATLGEAFDDSGSKLTTTRITGVAVAPEGTIYAVSHALTAESEGSQPGVGRIDPTGASLADPAISTLVKNQSEERPLLTGGVESAGSSAAGNQVSISPDGKTVYAVEAFREEAESYEIRGISTADGATVATYGGGTTSCFIGTLATDVAAGKDGIVYALDEGDAEYAGEEHTEPSSYGFHLIEFGPEGAGCPTPTTDFSVKLQGGSRVSESPIVVQHGEEVEFAASTTELHGETPAEVVWTGEGPEPFKAESVGTPASLTIKHKFLKSGTYTVTLSMKLKPGTFGPPPSVTKTVEVETPAPRAGFEASTLTPKAGEVVTFDGSESVDPTGEKLKSYTWNFGDGTSETTTTPTVTHSFANRGTSPIADTVSLIVADSEGIESAPSSETLTIQGTSVIASPLPGMSAPVPSPVPAPNREPTSVSPKAAFRAGAVEVTVTCPTSKTLCAGTIDLVTTVKSGKGRKRKTKVVTLGRGSFSLGEGAHKLVKVDLTTEGRALLKKDHSLKVTVQVKAHDAYGDESSKSLTGTLVSSKKKKA